MPIHAAAGLIGYFAVRALPQSFASRNVGTSYRKVAPAGLTRALH